MEVDKRQENVINYKGWYDNRYQCTKISRSMNR